MPKLKINDDTLVSVKSVSKKFCKNLRRSMAYGIIDLTKNLLGRRIDSTRIRKDEFWAIEDISFEQKRGEVLGLVGRNGSGKTTILRLLAGIFPPDKGEIAIKGKIGALIAVGAGFHPYMTGRENILLSGSILGMTKGEIISKSDEIVDFAEIGDFIDSPVSTYSSGMRIRLGFSISTAIDPDVLLLDEILAVGDRKFVAKCYNRIAKLRANSTTIFVSHNMNQISRICTSVIVCDKGRIVHNGDTLEGIRLYNSICSLDNDDVFVKTTPGFQLKSFAVDRSIIKWKDDLRFRVEFNAESSIDNCNIRVIIVDEYGENVAEWKAANYQHILNVRKGRNIYEDKLPNISLRDNKYYLTFVLNSPDNIAYLILANQYCSFTVRGNLYGVTHYQI